jgi:hypothetical protein
VGVGIQNERWVRVPKVCCVVATSIPACAMNVLAAWHGYQPSAASRLWFLESQALTLLPFYRSADGDCALIEVHI